MLEFIKKYRGFLLSCLLIPLGCGIMFGTLITVCTIGSTFLENFYKTIYVSELIWIGLVTIFMGLDFAFGGRNSEELVEEIKYLFEKK
jgi:hypothetical protein